jgi:hypothetical protein
VPKRGYRFIAPVDLGAAAVSLEAVGTTTVRLQKALWTNIAELRVAEARRHRRMRMALILALTLLAALAAYVILVVR